MNFRDNCRLICDRKNYNATFAFGIAMVLYLTATAVHAGVLGAVSSIFERKIRLKVQVLDEQSQAVPHATLWFIYADKHEPERSVDDMVRLVTRYQRDYDVAAVGSQTPIASVLTKQANAQGVFEIELKENNFEGLNALPVIVGVLKRGFDAAAYAESIPVGAAREYVLKLRRSADQYFDPRLLELDEIRSEIGNVFPNWTAGDRMAHVDRLHGRLVELAKAFEQEGKRHEAALAYYNLAYLPSIDRMTMPDGTVRVIGYTRGYDEKSPPRKAFLAKALVLGEDIPQLPCRALADSFSNQGGDIWADQSKLALRKQFAAELEACLTSADGRIFPWVILYLSDVYSYIGDPRKACDTLRRAYQFEPAAYQAKMWPRLFENVERNARKPIAGLPAFPDFACKMPS
jgi:hypothetical protein